MYKSKLTKLFDLVNQASIFNKSWLYFLILLSVILYAYYPFLSDYNIGGIDAQIYQYALHDALIQRAHNIFPVYVGQSEFSYFGISFMRAPYYLLFAQLLDLLTLHSLNSLYLQHLTVLTSAVFAGCASYLLFIKILPNLRWFALLLAILYVTSPGVMGLIYMLDMYFSFMTLPFIPIFIYGLIRSHQKHDLLAYIITGAALSLILMAHPPIAFWCLLICGLFYLIQFIFFRRGILGILIIIIMLFSLNLWQFISISELELTSDINLDPSYKSGIIQRICRSFEINLRNIFRPLSEQMLDSSFLEGYSLCIIFLSGVIVAIRSNTFLLRCFLINVTALFLLIYPIPYINHFLWSLFPVQFLEINLWPRQRIYLMLIMLACLLASLIVENIQSTFKYSKKSIIILLSILLCCFWNVYQIHYFIDLGDIRTDHKNTWQTSENIYLYALLIYGYKNSIDTGHYGTFIPQLKSKLLDKSELPLSNYDNEQVLLQQCLHTKSSEFKNIAIFKSKITFPLRVENELVSPIFNMTLTTKNPHLLACLDTDMNYGSNMEIESIINLKDQTTPSVSYGHTEKESIDKNNKEILLPIYNPQQLSTNELTFYFKGRGSINNFRLTTYDLNKLPIHVESFTPYKASVETKSDNVYLDMYKSYYRGYQAKVNGKIVPVLQTKRGNIKILLPKKGKYTIELVYIGTILMRISFYISLTAWCVLLIYFMFIWLSKKYNLAVDSIFI